MKQANVAASVRARLLNLSKSRGENFDLLLNRYASERLLFRLSQSPHRERFVLKGATLFALWLGGAHRPTRDLDFLGTGEPSVEAVETTFRAIVATPVEEDGLVFAPENVHGQRIKEDEEYEGVRVGIRALLLNARIGLQIDVGFGDVMTPGAIETEYPTLLGQSAPRLRVYPRETVVAEKFEAMVKLGQGNSRLKDFYDVWTLSRAGDFDTALLTRAVRATFERRGTPVPAEIPLALSEGFGEDESKIMQWAAFCSKSGIENAPPFPDVVEELRGFLWPLISK